MSTGLYSCTHVVAVAEPLFYSSRGAVAPRTPARADRLAGDQFLSTFQGILGFVEFFVGGLWALGGISFLFLLKFHVECRQNHVWGPPGARVMTNLVKHLFFAKVGKVGILLVAILLVAILVVAIPLVAILLVARRSQSAD